MTNKGQPRNAWVNEIVAVIETRGLEDYLNLVYEKWAKNLIVVMSVFHPYVYGNLILIEVSYDIKYN